MNRGPACRISWLARSTIAAILSAEKNKLVVSGDDFYRGLGAQRCSCILGCIATTEGKNIEGAVVLIVEDEAIIRIDAVQMLEDAGYITLEASNADDAIRILDGRMAIRVVFTDISMPESMDGLKLAHAICGRWPPIHLIVTSAFQHITEDYLPAKGRFVRKPYHGAQIISVFRELFAAA